jgi:DNA polymerase III alpha subunit
MDIDIDFLDRDQALNLFKHIRASRIDDNKLVKHNTGVYLHAVPMNALENLCAVPYEEAEEKKYFKIDFLNVGIYKGVRDEAHLIQLMNTEPLWDLLEQDDFSNLLFHVNGHGSILRQMKPTSVEQLAAVLAMIRPAKRYLIGKDWTTVMTEVWETPENDDYYFKKSHATAYAMAIVVQMNLICEGISYGYN